MHQYFCRANTGGPAQKPGREVEEWFESIKDAFGSLLDSQRIPDPMRITPDDHTPLSKLTAAWVFQDVREYLSPYEKRNYITNWDSKKLLTRGWPQWTADRIDEIQSKSSNVIENSETGCKLSVQIQNFGGEKSMFYQNSLEKATDGQEVTAFSWRDMTVSAVMDCFYDVTLNPKARQNGLAWHKQNEEGAYGTKEHTGHFSDELRKLLWSSFGDRNMGNVWRQYVLIVNSIFFIMCAPRNKFSSLAIFSLFILIVAKV